MTVNTIFILDLPNLTTISFNGKNILQGDGGENNKKVINGHESFDNTLIMKSELKLDWWL